MRERWSNSQKQMKKGPGKGEGERGNLSPLPPSFPLLALVPTFPTNSGEGGGGPFLSPPLALTLALTLALALALALSDNREL